MHHIWAILLCSLTCVLTQEDKEESACTLSTGEAGICKILSNCSYVETLLQEGRRPELCEDSKLQGLVCCVNETNKLEFTTHSATESSSNLMSIAGSISRKKCQDFYPFPNQLLIIAGGNKSLPKEFPHMAIIGFGDESNIQWECGGSLISYNFVLTAAHCLHSRYLGPAKWVRLGDLDLATDQDDANPQDFNVKRRIPHPDYKPPARYHDIALLELDRPVYLTDYVSPACLHTERELKEHNLTATGWGRTDYIDGPSSFLLKVDLSYVPNDKCLETFGKIPPSLLPKSIVDEWQICAGGVVGKDTCQGDSGGPLQMKNEERTFIVSVHTVVGVTSLGRACGLSGAPAVYTRVSNYISWIESIVWPNEE